MLLSEGQMSDYKGAALMLDALPKAKTLLGDKAYDADWLRETLNQRGIATCIPSKANRKKQIPHDRDLYRPGQPSLLNDTHRRAIAAVIESGPIPAVHGVVRWRLVDLCQWIFEELRISVAKQTLSRELRAMGYRKLSARPRHHAQAEGAIEDFKKRMARPVCKGVLRAPMISLLQRIRLRRLVPSQDGDTRAPVLISFAAPNAVF